MKFIVDRKTWYRGKGADESRLLREDGQRCCIGFVGKQSGLADPEMLNKNAISRCEMITINNWPKWMLPTVGPKSTPIQRAYHLNDDPTIPDADREDQLKEIFASQGDEIEFVG